MSSQEILEKFISFYTERGHNLIPNVSLVPENDPTLLFVNSGMFPLVPYLSGQPHPLGRRLVNVQRSLRFEDIDEIGDNTHTVVFHMIGNWSLGDYFKKEQLPWVYELLIGELGLEPDRLFATVFEGDEYAPKDEESIQIIKQIFNKYGVEAEEGVRIFACGREDNWWQRGEAVGELGGPDSEIFYYVGEGSSVGKSPMTHEDDFLEIGNSVFMQYRKTGSGWEELDQKNVDFGGGLERIALVKQEKRDIFETDNFWPIIQKIEELSGLSYYGDTKVTKSMRILADHMRASVLLGMDGVLPSNKDQGYILRRLLRRMTRAGRVLGVEKDISVSLVSVVVENFKWLYPQLEDKKSELENVFAGEEDKFRKTLDRARKDVEKAIQNIIGEEGTGSGLEMKLAEAAFNIYQSHGYPAEIFLDDVKDKGIMLDEKEFYYVFDEVFKTHQQGSRAGAEQKFRGGLADHSEEVVKYHTATHLLHRALREILGSQVTQHGSNITGERLRFDFNHPEKLSEEELSKLETFINDLIQKKYNVGYADMSREEAERTGALMAFGERYGEQVKVYYIGDSLDEAVSKEFCGGPHVSNTGELHPIEIYKQESIGKDRLRVYARFVDS
jgi:alanyl-tRNA synthetase